MMASLRYVARNLRRRRTRTLLGALGIFLTLALLHLDPDRHWIPFRSPTLTWWRCRQAKPT